MKYESIAAKENRGRSRMYYRCTRLPRENKWSSRKKEKDKWSNGGEATEAGLEQRCNETKGWHDGPLREQILMGRYVKETSHGPLIRPAPLAAHGHFERFRF